jgi:hypothetical protein
LAVGFGVVRRLEAIEADIAALDRRVGDRLDPYGAPHALLMQIPGADWVVGGRLSPGTMTAPAGRRAAGPKTATHLPAHDPGRRRDLRLANQGQASSRTTSTASRPPRRLARRALAIAHKILVCAYHMLAKNLPYRGEAGPIGHTRTVANLNAASIASAIASSSNPMPRPRNADACAAIFMEVTGRLKITQQVPNWRPLPQNIRLPLS